MVVSIAISPSLCAPLSLKIDCQESSVHRVLRHSDQSHSSVHRVFRCPDQTHSYNLSANHPTQVLEYAVDRAWSAVGEHVVAHLISLFGMRIEQIMHVPCTDGQPLIYR